MSLAAGTHLGSYTVVGLLGAGGMGEVYRARDGTLDRDVALKILPAAWASDPERVARFEREARTLAALNHPHIAHVYGFEQANGVSALVMELVEGEDLSQRIARGRLPLDEALPIARQIADALAAAHEQGIVHRDLKPANIKVRADGTVKVLDFGLAKALDQVSGIRSQVSGDYADSRVSSPTITSPASLTYQGAILGTAAYMSPEQARGKAIDRRTDIWAFGCVLYEMLTGERPFKGDDVTEVLASVVKDRPDMRQVPREVRRLIARCLEKDPKARLRDIGDVWALLDTEAVTPSSATTPVWWRGAVPAWIIAGIAMLALALVAGAHFRESMPEPVVVRSSIAPPDNTVFDFDLTLGPAVISPDGRRVAFAARSADGRRQIWTRDLASLVPRAIDGTDGAYFPFWSPDSQLIGFYRAGRLFKVALSGGLPVPITESPFVRGASWGSAGTIVFDGGNAIWSVDAGGGQPVRQTTVDTSSGEAAHRSPWFLPDGRHYVFWVGGKNQIRLAALGSPDSQVVTEATSNAIYASGHLLFLRESSLFALPFDAVRLAASGEALQLADDVSRVVGEPRGVFSASTEGTLIYQTGGSAPALSLAWFDRGGDRLSTIGELGDASNLELAPDEKSALVTISDPQGRAIVWRVDLSDGSKSRLTSDVVVNGVWSPDGREIVYARIRDGHGELLRKPSIGLDQGMLLYTGTFDTSFRVSSWSSDGRHLLMTASRGIHALPLTAANARGAPDAYPLISGAVATSGQFSPNGRWVLYQSAAPAVGSAVFVEAFPNRGLKQQVAEAGTNPRWQPDGKQLYYQAGAVLTADRSI